MSMATAGFVRASRLRAEAAAAAARKSSVKADRKVKREGGTLSPRGKRK